MSTRPKNESTGCADGVGAPVPRFGAGAFSLCAISHFDLWTTLRDRSQQCDGGRLQTSSFSQGQAALRFPSCTPMMGQKKAPRLLTQWRALNAKFAGYRLNRASIFRVFCQCSTGRKTVVACISRCLTGAAIGLVVRTLWPRKNQCLVTASGSSSQPSAACGFSNFKVGKTHPKKHYVSARESVASVVKVGPSRSLIGTSSHGLVMPVSWNLKHVCAHGGPDFRGTPRRLASRSPLATKVAQPGISRCTQRSGRSRLRFHAAACGDIFGVKRFFPRPISTRRAKLTSGSVYGPQGSTAAQRAVKRAIIKGSPGSCRSSGNGSCSNGFATISSSSGSFDSGAKTPSKFPSIGQTVPDGIRF